MESSALTALSPVDGRYAAAVAPLRDYFSEAALIRERIRVEGLWVLLLTGAPGPPPRAAPSARAVPRPRRGVGGGTGPRGPRRGQGYRAAYQSRRQGGGVFRARRARRGRRQCGGARAGAFRLHFRGHQQSQLCPAVARRTQRRAAARAAPARLP